MKNVPEMRTNRLTFVPLVLILLFVGCKDETERVTAQVEFAAESATVDEGHEVVIEVTFDKATANTEYVTFSIQSNAVFGVDYGIDNLYELQEEFTVKIAPNSRSAAFTFIALEDFEPEASELVEISISEVSKGLVHSGASFSIEINNVVNHDASNRAIAFDGVDDYIDLGNIYDDVALPITISAWIWLDPTAAEGKVMPIFDSQDGLPVYNGFNFLTSTASTAGVQYGDGLGENHSVYRRAKAATFSPVMGRWVNFTAVVISAVDMRIYFNGVDVGGQYFGESNNPMKSYSPTEVAKIGALYQNGVHYNFKGKIDELKIWNRALPENEIQKTIFARASASEPGLIGYWNFDEPTGEHVLDASTNSYDGVIKGNATRVLSEVPIR